MPLDDVYAILQNYLTEYQVKALDDAISAFGYNENTIDCMLYVWYGMESECFIDECLGV